jgi:hypothetical protein
MVRPSSSSAQPVGAVDGIQSGQSSLDTAAAHAANRPAVALERFTEDWSVLADPGRRTRAFDRGKYIALSPGNPASFVSLGLDLRERWELVAAPNFATGGNRQDAYLLHRLQAHADIHLDADWRVFLQVGDMRAPGKRVVTPVDENPLDLNLAFLEYTARLGPAVVQARAGRQEFQFDLQRFLSSRDGPNVRQSFDAVWAAYDAAPWRVAGFVSRPVQTSFQGELDDRSSRRFRFSLLRLERSSPGSGSFSGFYALYERDAARFLDVSGDERRHVLDGHVSGEASGFDWDLEAMGQAGHIGPSSIRAWALGSRIGYTLDGLSWHPRLGLQADAASGDQRAGDHKLGTFNPLFPNGYYFNLAGFTGYSNLLHIKPSVMVSPLHRLRVSLAAGLQWRMTTADAVYVQSAAPVPLTAGRGGGWSGLYAQLRADYSFNENLTGAVEAVRFQAGSALHTANGHDASYLGTELKLSW